MSLEEFIVYLDMRNEQHKFLAFSPLYDFGSHFIALLRNLSVKTCKVSDPKRLLTNDIFIIETRLLWSQTKHLNLNFTRASIPIQHRSIPRFSNKVTKYSELTNSCYVTNDFKEICSWIQKDIEMYQQQITSAKELKESIWLTVNPPDTKD